MSSQKTDNFKRIFEAINDGISLIDTEGRQIAVNSAMCRITGFDEDELLNSTPPHIYWPEEELENINKAFEQTLKGSLNDFELIFKHKNGSRFPVLVYPSTLQDDRGNIEYYVATVKDLTEFKKQQNLLEITQHNFQMLMDNTSELVCRHNVEGLYLEVSQNAKDIIGYEAVELIGRNPYDFFHPEDIQRIQRESHELAKNNDKPPRIIYRYHHKNGKYVWLDTVSHPILGKNGQVMELLTISRDLTEIKELELALKNNITQLKASNKDLENFAYTASHDLREPLRMISGFSQLLNEKYAETLDQEAKKYVEIINSGAKRQEVLISNLLQYSRINSQEFTFQNTDLNQTLSEVTLSLQALIEENNAKIIVDKLPTLPVEPVQIKRVFGNLIQNAIKYRSEFPPEIHISSKKRKEYFQISVTDNGVGIREEDYERVFLIFKRLVPNNAIEGVGMGLSICKRIIEKHHGKIWIETNKESGVSFTVELPKNQ